MLWTYVNPLSLISDEDSGVQYRPVIDENHAVGYEATHPDGRVEFIMFNPSGGSDDGVPTVFVYIDTGGPVLENAVHHYIMFEED